MAQRTGPVNVTEESSTCHYQSGVQRLCLAMVQEYDDDDLTMLNVPQEAVGFVTGVLHTNVASVLSRHSKLLLYFLWGFSFFRWVFGKESDFASPNFKSCAVCYWRRWSWWLRTRKQSSNASFHWHNHPSLCLRTCDGLRAREKATALFADLCACLVHVALRQIRCLWHVCSRAGRAGNFLRSIEEEWSTSSDVLMLERHEKGILAASK